MVSAWTVVVFPVLMSTIFSKAVKCSLRAFKVSLQLALFRILVFKVFFLIEL